jgi:hypothetical protein
VVGQFDAEPRTNAYSLFEFTPGWGAVDIFWWARDIEIAPPARSSARAADRSAAFAGGAGRPPIPGSAPQVRR